MQLHKHIRYGAPQALHTKLLPDETACACKAETLNQHARTPLHAAVSSARAIFGKHRSQAQTGNLARPQIAHRLFPNNVKAVGRGLVYLNIARAHFMRMGRQEGRQ